MIVGTWTTCSTGNGSAPDGFEAPEHVEERLMLERCAAGDEQAIRWLLGRYRPRIVRLAASVLRNSRDAEDVAQDAFVRAFRQKDEFRNKTAFYAWLYRIVINLCLDRLRRKSLTCELTLESAGRSLISPPPDVEGRLAIQQVLNSLSPRLRSALVLRELEGLDYNEMADVLAIPVGTVRSRLFAAREQFRARWTAISQEADCV